MTNCSRDIFMSSIFRGFVEDRNVRFQALSVLFAAVLPGNVSKHTIHGTEVQISMPSNSKTMDSSFGIIAQHVFSKVTTTMSVKKTQMFNLLVWRRKNFFHSLGHFIQRFVLFCHVHLIKIL